MLKKICCVSLAALCCFTAVNAIGCGKRTNDIATVWTTLSTETYLQDIMPETFTQAKLDFVGIKGETEAMQLMITAKKDITEFDLKLNDLFDDKGNVITKDNIKAYAEKYVEIVDPYMNSGNTTVTDSAYAGFYPDALVPFELYKEKGENKIDKRLNQGVWIDVRIPVSAKAGDYTGEFILSLGQDIEVKIPVTLKVYDIVMPEKVHSRTAFNIWHTQLESGEKSNYDENTNQIYYDYLLTKRLCSAYVPAERRDTLDEFVDYMAVMADNPRVTTYTIRHEYLNISDVTNLSINSPNLQNLSEPERQAKYEFACKQTYDGMINLFTKMLAKNLEADKETKGIDLFEKAIFHFEDEPTRGYRVERCRKFNEILTKAKKDFIESNKRTFEEYPHLKDSLLNCFKDITPTDMLDGGLFVSTKDDGNGNMVPDYEKGDGVTLWCIHAYKVQSSAARKIIKERQSYGEQFWWYTCTRTSPVPSYYLEARTMNMRLMSWQQYEHGFKGMLYWDVVQWSQLPDKDPFKSLKYGNYGSGEGILLYPGYKYGTKTPISSIRLEQISQGQEDYEYLYMFNKFISAYNLENGTTYDTQAIVAKMISKMHTGSHITKEATSQKLEDCRIKILEILNEFTKGNQDVAISLIKSEI